MAVTSEHGFSSLELIICSILVCLSITTALPKLINADKLELEYEAIHMINDIRYVQSLSDTKSISDKFSQHTPLAKPYIMLNNNSYTIYYMNNDEEMKKIIYVFPKDVKYVQYGKKIYYFSKDSVSNTITISLKKNTYVINIIIDKAGRVRMSRIT